MLYRSLLQSAVQEPFCVISFIITICCSRALLCYIVHYYYLLFKSPSVLYRSLLLSAVQEPFCVTSFIITICCSRALLYYIVHYYYLLFKSPSVLYRSLLLSAVQGSFCAISFIITICCSRALLCYIVHYYYLLFKSPSVCGIHEKFDSKSSFTYGLHVHTDLIIFLCLSLPTKSSLILSQIKIWHFMFKFLQRIEQNAKPEKKSCKRGFHLTCHSHTEMAISKARNAFYFRTLHTCPI